MAERLTFLHAADLHLGAPFRGARALSETWGNRLVAAISEAYDRVVDAAIARKVDFVVIAGDVFDSARPSYGDYVHFFAGLRRLDQAGIPVYLVTGNHDPYTSWSTGFGSFPPSTIMLPADHAGFCLYRREGRPMCLIGGRGYYNQTWPSGEWIGEGVTRREAELALESSEPDAREAPFAVGILHTGLNLDPFKAPSDPRMLMRAGMDYWALGHIHAKYAYPSFADPRLVFSGCIQGRDIKETGERGVFVVTLTEGAPNRIEFVPTASVVWQRMDVDVADCDTLTSVCDKVMRELFRANSESRCGQMITRIRLTGTTPLHATLSRPGLMEDVRKHLNDSYSEFFCDALEDHTTAPRDLDALRAEGLFPATFLTVADAQRDSAIAEVAFLQDEFLKRNIALPASCIRRVDDLARDAENLVLDLLVAGDEA